MAKVTLKRPTRVASVMNARKRRHATEEEEATEGEPAPSGRASKRRRPAHEEDAFDFPPDPESIEGVSSTTNAQATKKTRGRPPSLRSAKANVVARQIIPESSLASTTSQSRNAASKKNRAFQAQIDKLEAQIAETRRKDTGVSAKTLLKQRKEFERQLLTLRAIPMEDANDTTAPNKMTRSEVEAEVARLSVQIKQVRDGGKHPDAEYRRRRMLKDALKTQSGDILVPNALLKGRLSKDATAEQHADTPEETEVEMPTTKRTVKRTGRHLESVVKVVVPTRAQKTATRAQKRTTDADEEENETEDIGIPPSAQAPRTRSAVPESEADSEHEEDEEDQDGDQDRDQGLGQDGEADENEDRKLVQRYKFSIQNAKLPETGSKARHVLHIDSLKRSFTELADRVLRENDSKVSISDQCSRDLISDFRAVDATRRREGDIDRGQLKEDLAAIASGVDKVKNLQTSSPVFTDICAFIIPIGFRVFLDFFLSIEHKNPEEPEEELLETAAALVEHLVTLSKHVNKTKKRCSIIEIRTTITQMIGTLEVLADDIANEAERLRRNHESIQSLAREMEARRVEKERRLQAARKQQIASHLASIKSMVSIPHLAVQYILAGNESRPKEMIQALQHYEPEWFEKLRTEAWERSQNSTEMIHRLRYMNLSEFCEDIFRASLDRQGGLGAANAENGAGQAGWSSAAPAAQANGITNDWDWDSD